MPNHLSLNRQRRYLRNGATECPHCEGQNLHIPEKPQKGADVNTLQERVVCLNCKEEWLDVYILARIEQVS